MKADVVVEGFECEVADSLKRSGVLVGHNHLPLLELLLLVDHDGSQIKGVGSGRHFLLLVLVNKKKVIVNDLSNEIEGGKRTKGLSTRDKRKASEINTGDDKGFGHSECILWIIF